MKNVSEKKKNRKKIKQSFCMHTLNHNQDVTITKISGTEDKEVDPTTGVEVDELWRQRHDKNKHIKGYVLSMRQTSKPKYLEDYVLLAEE